MDDKRFDGAVRSVGARANRRGALGLLSALGLGWLGRGWDEAEAKKKRKKKSARGVKNGAATPASTRRRIA